MLLNHGFTPLIVNLSNYSNYYQQIKLIRSLPEAPINANLLSQRRPGIPLLAVGL